MKIMHLAEMNNYVAGRGTTGEKTRAMMENIGHELKTNPPKILATTRRKFGAKRAEKQRKAILLNKARARGAKIPEK